MAAGRVGAWLASIDDHDILIEDTEEGLSVREQEDAANDLLAEQISMAREEHETCCQICGAAHADIPHTALTLKCRACGETSLLSPAPPLLVRAEGAAAEGAAQEPAPTATCEKVRFSLHGEGGAGSVHVRSLLTGEADAYQAQWLVLAAADGAASAVAASDEGVEPEGGVVEGGVAEAGVAEAATGQAEVFTMIKRGEMAEWEPNEATRGKRLQLRVRARIGGKWTPFRPPSVTIQLGAFVEEAGEERMPDAIPEPVEEH